MRSASQIFSDEQKQRINQAVGQAEAGTSAEIVPVVATASGRYDRPEDMVGLWLGLVGLVVAWLAFPPARAEPGAWGGPSPWVRLLVLLAAVLAGFVVGAVLATYVGWLRRLFTPRRQMAEEVAARAREVFFDNRLHHTAGATGLCVYVSLYERMAMLIADRAVMEKLGRQALDELRDRLVADLRAGDVTDAICSTLRAAGERLAPVLPRAVDDVNELPDALVTID